MNTKVINEVKVKNLSQSKRAERGSATVIAVLVLGLLTIFVALAISRTTSEAMVMGNDAAEGRSYTASQASLETMTRNFNKVFDIKLTPDSSDIANIQNAAVPGFPEFTFNQTIRQTGAPEVVVLTSSTYKGLNALRDAWRLQTIAKDTTTGVQVAMMREFFNNRIPIFQFGIFYEDDMSLFNPPLFKFGGRVHSNRNLFVTSGSNDIYFNSRISAVGEFVTYTRRNWDSSSDASTKIYVKNASGSYVNITGAKGSVISTSSGATDNVFAQTPFFDNTLPPSKINPAWAGVQASLDNNVLTRVKPLKLPIAATYNDMIELVRRGKSVGDLYNNGTTVVPVTTTTAENTIAAKEKFANKAGIRISLADSKAKLPGCASGVGTAAVTTQCGIRLDGDAVPGANGTYSGASRGYQPLPMLDIPTPYTATRLNGERFFTNGREMWIKVELVSINTTTGLPQAVDVTEDFLSMGVTEQAPLVNSGGVKFQISGYDHNTTTGTDSRSIIKLQRFFIPGPSIPVSTTPANGYLSSYTWNSTGYNIVVRTSGTNPLASTCTGGAVCAPVNSYATPYPSASPAPTFNEAQHLKLAAVNSAIFNKAIVPFPIKMFDTREGLYYDSTSTTYIPSGGQVNDNGVMSIIDIDVANMKRFLSGTFDGKFPITTPFALNNGGVGLKSFNVPDSNGWVVYVSDRRGDFDFDGEYDMEDIYGAVPGNDGILQAPEDTNRNGILNVDFTNEAVPYSVVRMPDYAAVTDQRYYRRAVRVINGTSLPGNFDSSNPANTKGFSVASENGVYVKGNYNATGVSSYPVNDSTPSSDYQPQNTSAHIPAAIMADSVTILSNGWEDAESFKFPFVHTSRVAAETTLRFAMLAGDTMSGKNENPVQAPNYQRLAGGVHNFKRFLEDWNGINLNYTGSLINLYNSRNNNGSYKCCLTVYRPPKRNWIFDMTFTDPNRLPPGTPFFQYIEMTGFMRLNN